MENIAFAEILNWKGRARLISEGKATVTETSMIDDGDSPIGYADGELWCHRYVDRYIESPTKDEMF